MSGAPIPACLAVPHPRGDAELSAAGRLPGPMAADAELVQRLVEAAQAGDLDRARAVVASWLATQPLRAGDVYFGLVLPAVRRLERAWSDDRIGYDGITLAFHTLQRLLQHALGATRPGPARSRGLVCLSLLPGGEHQFGLLVVADALQAAGWTVRLFEGDRTAALLDTLARDEVALLGLSLGNDRELALAPGLVAKARAVSKRQPLRVLIGGNVLHEPAGQYAFVQADGVAFDAASAVAFAAALPVAPRAGAEEKP